MAIGYALVRVHPLREQEVLEKLRSIPEVEDVYMLFGEYDIILKIRTAQMDAIAEIVVKKIRSLRGVSDTKTLISTRFFPCD